MTSPIFSLEQLDAVYKIEQDWLFEKLLEKLNAHRHLILSADQGWGVQEYVSELGFQLAEKHPEQHGYPHITRINREKKNNPSCGIPGQFPPVSPI